MPTDPTPPRRPFGERDSEERSLPFGARPPAPRPPAPSEPDEPQVDHEPQIDRDTRQNSESQPAPFAPRSKPDQAGVGARDHERASTSIEEALGANGGQPAAAPAPDQETDSGEPPLNDEPEDAPPLVAVRSQHRRAAADSDMLKARPAKKGFHSYPAQDAAEAERQAAREAAHQRAQTALRLRVIFQTMAVMFAGAAVFATLLTWWTPNTFLPADSMDQLSVALATQTAPAVEFIPTLTPPGSGPAVAATVNRNQVVGIVSGHKGLNPGSGLPDPGAVCDDGVTEQKTVEKVADQVAEFLQGAGYTVDILEEFDPRLNGYSGLAVVSIHADSCDYINDDATGFKVASFAESTNPGEDDRLVSCIISRYSDTTHMAFHPSVTYDMTQYHTFRELQAGTPGAIIEVGFMYLDKEMLTQHSDIVALGVARGLLCYLRNEPVNANNVATPSAEPSEDASPTP